MIAQEQITKMNYLSVMQFSNSSQTIPEDLLSDLHRDLLPDKAQKVVHQISIHEYVLSRYGITW